MLSQFPTQPTPFVGRTKELADIGIRLANPECRLMTVTGAGGSGKTRLALAAADASAALFTHGTALVNLLPLRSLDVLLPAIAHELGLALYGSGTQQQQIF